MEKPASRSGNLAGLNLLLDDSGAGQAAGRASSLPPLDSLTATQQQAVAQQLVARMTPEQQQVVAQLGEKEQLRVLQNFYERLFIPPRTPPWHSPSGVSAAPTLSSILARQPRPAPAVDLMGPSSSLGGRSLGLQQGIPPLSAAAATVQGSVGERAGPSAFTQTHTDGNNKLQMLAALATSPSPAPSAPEPLHSPKRLKTEGGNGGVQTLPLSAIVGSSTLPSSAYTSSVPGFSAVLHLAEALHQAYPPMASQPAATQQAEQAPATAVVGLLQHAGAEQQRSTVRDEQPPTAVQVWSELKPFVELTPLSNGGDEGADSKPQPAAFLDKTLLARFCAAYASHPARQRLEELALVRALVGEGELGAAREVVEFYAGCHGSERAAVPAVVLPLPAPGASKGAPTGQAPKALAKADQGDA